MEVAEPFLPPQFFTRSPGPFVRIPVVPPCLNALRDVRSPVGKIYESQKQRYSEHEDRTTISRLVLGRVLQVYLLSLWQFRGASRRCR